MTSKTIQILVCSIILTTISFINHANVEANTPETTGTVLIRFAEDTPAETVDAMIAGLGGTMLNWYPRLNVAEVTFGNDGGLAMGFDTVSHPAIDYVEPEIVVSGVSGELNGVLTEITVNDPDFADSDKSYAPQMIELAGGWSYTQGSNDVVIAVLDTGLNLNHPEFVGRITVGYDFIHNDHNPSDDHGHGTHATGIMAAAVNNQQGSAGVCPNCMIMPVKVLNEYNMGTWSTVASGIYYAVDNGADIINLSLGAQTSNQTIERAIDYAVEHGVLIVGATGNAAASVAFYPAAYEDVLAVSATNHLDAYWTLSNYGAYVSVSAPGRTIYSTYHDFNQNGGYTTMSGTSMAAPHVTGLAGLLLSQNSDLSMGDVQALIEASADDLGEAGHDEHFGHGRINVRAALEMGATYTSASSLSATEVVVPQNTPVFSSTQDESAENYTIFLPVVES